MEWLDANFVCVLQLPPDEFKNLQGVIEAQWTGNPEEYRLESATWAYTAIPDEAEKTVTLRASSKPGH